MQADDDDQEPEKTLLGAHTRRDPAGDGRDQARPVEADPERAAKIGETAATAQAALDDLAGLIDQDEPADQLDLLDDEQSLFLGPVNHVAETFRQAKGRGRPKGSKNKANQLFRDYLLKQGYRHPGLNLADLANASPAALATELACKRIEAAHLIKSANEALMPYFESKRPTETVHTENRLGVMVIQQMDARGERAPEGVISLTGEVRQKSEETDT